MTELAGRAAAVVVIVGYALAWVLAQVMTWGWMVALVVWLACGAHFG